jgi:hypothetical protein
MNNPRDDDDEPRPTAAPARPSTPLADMRWRCAFVGRPEVHAALLATLEACPEEHRLDILHEGCGDALADDSFPADEDQALGFVKRKVDGARRRFRPPSGELREVDPPVASLDRHLADADARAVAAEFNAPEVTESTGARLMAAKGRAVLVVAGLLLLVGMAYLRSRGTEHAVRATAEPTLAPSAPAVETTPHLRALAIVREALRACDAEEWTVCVARLDAASVVDPEVERDIRVKDARAAAARRVVRPDGAPAAALPVGPKVP